jgi:hypothetical protein
MKEVEDNLTIVENELEDFLQKHPILVAALPEIKEIIKYYEDVVFEECLSIDVEEYHSSWVLKAQTQMPMKTALQVQRRMFHDPVFIEIIKKPSINHFLTLHILGRIYDI